MLARHRERCRIVELRRNGNEAELQADLADKADQSAEAELHRQDRDTYFRKSDEAERMRKLAAEDALPNTLEACDAEIARAERIAAIADGCGNADARIVWRNWRASLVLHRRRLAHDRFGVGFTQNSGGGVATRNPPEVTVVRR
jgi:hypothetical protein